LCRPVWHRPVAWMTWTGGLRRAQEDAPRDCFPSFHPSALGRLRGDPPPARRGPASIGRGSSRRPGGIAGCRHQPDLWRWRELRSDPDERLHRAVQPWHLDGVTHGLVRPVRKRDRHRELRRHALERLDRARSVLPRPAGRRRRRDDRFADSGCDGLDRDGGRFRQGHRRQRVHRARLQRRLDAVPGGAARTDRRPRRLRDRQLLRRHGGADTLQHDGGTPRRERLHRH